MFPLSTIPLDAEPQQDWCLCLECGEQFPDIYPSGRCPFEYEHYEWVTCSECGYEEHSKLCSQYPA